MVFLTTFSAHGGPLDSDEAALARYFPEPEDAGSKPAIVVGTRHTRDVSALQAIRELIDGCAGPHRHHQPVHHGG